MKKIYLNYVIKKPYLYFLFIFMGIGTILFLMMTINVPLISTYTAKIEKSQDQYLLSCDEAAFKVEINDIFLYKDKNESIYKIIDYTILNENQIIFQYKEDTFFTSIDDQLNDIYIEISFQNSTLFEEIFIQGGRN